jgi:hypothetical protein
MSINDWWDRNKKIVLDKKNKIKKKHKELNDNSDIDKKSWKYKIKFIYVI